MSNHNARTEDDSVALTWRPWRQGRRVPRNVYAVGVGDEDVLVGQFDSEWLAFACVDAHNRFERHVCREGVLIEALLEVLRAVDGPDQPGETQRLADVSQIVLMTLQEFGYR